MIPIPEDTLTEMAALFNTSADKLSMFGGGKEENDGVVYAYPVNGGRRLLKIQAIPAGDKKRGLFCLRERLGFADFLGRNGAAVSYPHASPKGNLFECVSSDSYEWIGYAMEIIPGIVGRPDAWDPDFFTNWGKTIGRLHRLAKEYPSWKSSVDPETGEECLTWQEEWLFFHDWCRDPDAREKWLELKELMDRLPVTRNDFGFIHNDAHLFNLIRDNDKITVIDFDVANHHWFLTDIAIASQTILFAITGGMNRPLSDARSLNGFFGYFLHGYKQENILSGAWLSRLDMFIAYRRLLLFTVMYDGIKSNPDRLRSWKEMIRTQPVLCGDITTEL